MSNEFAYLWAKASRRISKDATLSGVLAFLADHGMKRDQRRHAYHGWLAANPNKGRKS